MQLVDVFLRLFKLANLFVEFVGSCLEDVVFKALPGNHSPFGSALLVILEDLVDQRELFVFILHLNQLIELGNRETEEVFTQDHLFLLDCERQALLLAVLEEDEALFESDVLSTRTVFLVFLVGDGKLFLEIFDLLDRHI